MKTTWQVIRDHESGQYEDYIHDRDVVFEASSKDVALTIARMECEDERASIGEYVTEISDVVCGDDYGYQISDGDELTVCFFVHPEDVYETEQEYIQYRKIRERNRRECELAHKAHMDFYYMSNEHVNGPIDYDVVEIDYHITVDFWTRGEFEPHYQVQYDEGEITFVRKWTSLLENGKPDPDSCVIYKV